jgi:hypothetical protein
MTNPIKRSDLIELPIAISKAAGVQPEVARPSLPWMRVDDQSMIGKIMSSVTLNTLLGKVNQ